MGESPRYIADNLNGLRELAQSETRLLEVICLLASGNGSTAFGLAGERADVRSPSLDTFRWHSRIVLAYSQIMCSL